MSIPIYSAEIEAGIGESVKSNASIAYTSPIVKFDNEPIKDELLCKFALANVDLNYDRIDLYPLYSVLVSVGTNKNDDIFLGEEVWAARNSPEDKPLNLQHRNSDIVGHITANYPVDCLYKLIASDTPLDRLPEKFHIITASVIYKYWEDKSRQRQIAQILEEIATCNPPKHYVSMECMFRNFSYGITRPNGQTSILDRNEKTAGLTRHLRAYGGTGIVGEYKIGRVLRNITFSAHGIVDNPANTESIIFSDMRDLNLNLTSLGYNFASELLLGENQMTDTVNIEKVLAELKEEVAKGNLHKMHALEAQIEALKKGADEHHRELDKRHGDLQGLQKEHEEKMAAVSKELNEWKNKAEAAEKKAEEDEKEMARLKAENEYEKKVNEEFKKASKKKDRAEALKKTNIDSNRLNTDGLMDTIATLDDATFDTIVNLFSKSESLEDQDIAEKTSKTSSVPTASIKADFGAHPIDGEATTSDSTKTEDVDQFGKTKPKNPLSGDCSMAADPNNVITAAVIETNANLGVSVDSSKDYEKTQADIAKFLNSKNKKK